MGPVKKIEIVNAQEGEKNSKVWSFVDLKRVQTNTVFSILRNKG